MPSVLQFRSSLARRLVFRAGFLFALVSTSACANSDKPAQPQPDNPKPVAQEKTAETKEAEEKAAADKAAEEKAAAEKAAAEKAAADKAAEEKKAADEKKAGDEKKAAKPADAKAGDAPKSDPKATDDAKKVAETSKTEVAKPTKLESKTGILAKGVADKYVKEGGQPVIRLLDNGAEPRARAIYAVSKGTGKPLQMAMDVEMAMKSGELEVPSSKMPRMLLVFSFTTGDKSGANWPVEGNLTKVSLDPQGAQQEQIAKLLTPQLGAVKGLTMKYFIDERGRTRDVKVKPPENLEGIADQMLKGLSQTADTMTSPLPQEAIGVGAKWEVLARISANGADLLQITTYTLEKRDGNVLSLDAAVQQFAAKESTNPPGMPPGASARLLSYKCKGAGKPVFDLGDVAPMSGNVSTSTSMDLEIKMEIEGQMEKQVTSATTKMSASYTRLSP